MFSFNTAQIDITQLTPGATVLGSNVYPAVDVTDVTQSTTGTTKQYNVAQLLQFVLTAIGLDVYPYVNAASIVNYNAVYNNGVSGVGRTLTNAGTKTAFTIDGEAGIQFKTYLIKNQVNPAQNGIYSLTTVGDGSTNWVLTAPNYFDQVSNINDNGLVFVNTGIVNAGTMWQLNYTSPLVVGTTALTWSPFTFSPVAFFTWNVVSGTSQTIVPQNGYVTSNTMITTFTLPTTMSSGQTFRIAGFGTGGWKLVQNAGQIIAMGNEMTTLGDTGFLSSTNPTDSIEVLCISPNTTFLVLNMMGNITYN